MFYKSLIKHNAARNAAGIILLLLSPALRAGVQHSDVWSIRFEGRTIQCALAERAYS